MRTIGKAERPGQDVKRLSSRTRSQEDHRISIWEQRIAEPHRHRDDRLLCSRPPT